MSDQERPSIASLLEAVNDSVERAAESPFAQTDPLYLLLDLLQISLNAARIDAFIESETGGSIIASSALSEERNALATCSRSRVREYAGEDHNTAALFQLGHSHDFGDARLRSDLKSLQFELVLKLAVHLRLGSGRLAAVHLFWSKCSDISPLNFSGSDVCAILDCLSRLRGRPPAENADQHRTASDNVRTAFGDPSDDPDARDVLSLVVSRFDDGLRRRLSQLDAPTSAKYLAGSRAAENPFQIQYFWSVPIGSLGRPTLVPVFTQEQRHILCAEAQKMIHDSSERCLEGISDVDEVIDRVQSYRMDSRFAFTGYVAETGVSVHVENWPEQDRVARPVGLTEIEMREREIFTAITRRCQVLAAEEDSTQNSTPCLFTVPVSIGTDTLFVVQVNRLGLFPQAARAFLRPFISTLAGYLVFVAETQSALKDVRREAEFASLKSFLYPEAMLRSLAHDMLHRLPARAAWLDGVVESASQRDTCTVSVGMLRSLLSDIRAAIGQLRDLHEKMAVGRYDEKRILNLIDVLNDAIEGVPRARNERLHIHKTGKWSEPVWIRGNDFALKAVIQNIILNAAEATSAKSDARLDIAVAVAAPTGSPNGHTKGIATVEFTDNGSGLPDDPKEVERLWELNVSRGRKGGTGWGLHLVRYFVRKHNGRAFFDLGHKEGARLIVELPLCEGGSGQ